MADLARRTAGRVVIDPTRVPPPAAPAPPPARRVITLPGIGIAVAAWLLELGVGLVAAVGIGAIVWFAFCRH